MSKLKPCPFCGGSVTREVIEGRACIDCKTCERHHWEADITCRYQGADGLVEWWNTRAERTCHYFPDEYQTAFDENDEEIETGEACADVCDYSCDVCGYTMLGGDEGGWFEETPGEYGGWNYKPRFDYCPNCGARVVIE